MCSCMDILFCLSSSMKVRIVKDERTYLLYNSLMVTAAGGGWQDSGLHIVEPIVKYFILIYVLSRD